MRKTVLGIAEVRTRSANLPIRSRAVLIMVNEKDDVASLNAKIGDSAEVILYDLTVQGLIEQVPSIDGQLTVENITDKSLQTETLQNQNTTDGEASSKINLVEPEKSGLTKKDLYLLSKVALKRMTPHFGPDVFTVVNPLIMATSIEAYRFELQRLEEKLRIYLTRKDIEKLMNGLKL